MCLCVLVPSLPSHLHIILIIKPSHLSNTHCEYSHIEVCDAGMTMLTVLTRLRCGSQNCTVPSMTIDASLCWSLIYLTSLTFSLCMFHQTLNVKVSSSIFLHQRASLGYNGIFLSWPANTDEDVFVREDLSIIFSWISCSKICAWTVCQEHYRQVQYYSTDNGADDKNTKFLASSKKSP